MKSISKFLFICCASLAFSLSSCNSHNGTDSTKQEATKLSFDTASYEVYEDDTFVVSYTTNSTKTPSFSSENSSVASISSSGRVIAKSVGATKLKASIDDVFTTCDLIVKSLSEKNEDYITFENKQLIIGLNEETNYSIKPTYYHDNASVSDKTFTFESLDSEVANVSDSGVITPLKDGSTLVKVSSGDVSSTVFVDVYTVKINNVTDWKTMLNTLETPYARYYLNNDLDFAEETYEVYSGYNSDWTKCYHLMGVLEGNNHTVKNIFMNPSNNNQSIFGYATWFTVQNISFINVNFNTKSGGTNCGLFQCLMVHKTITDDKGNKSNVMGDTLINNVLCDFIVNDNVSDGIANTFYGGGVTNTFIQFTHKDGNALNKNRVFAITKEFLTWFQPNFVTNFVAYVPNGDVSLEAASYVAGVEIEYTNVFKTNSLIEADYYVSQYFDNNIWNVEPNSLPELKK